MNPERLPGWLRIPLRWWLNCLLRKAPASLECPLCRQPIARPTPLPDTLWDTLVECGHCGHAMSVIKLGAALRRTPEERAAEGIYPLEKPPGSRIEVEDTGAERVWRVPAKGGCSSMLVFAVLWLAFCSIFVAVIAFGKWENDEGGWGRLGVSAFIGGFVLVGLGMLYAALRMTRSRHTLRLDAVEFVHERHFMGHTTRKAWPRESVRSVALVVFYSENYKPVHGIELRGERGKIRFGSALDAEEKAWLCRNLRISLGLEVAPTAADLEHRETVLRQPLVQMRDPANPKHIHIEQTPDGCTIAVPPGKGGWMMFVVGCIFLSVGGFMIHQGLGMWVPHKEGAPAAFQFVFNGFILFWCAGVAVTVPIGLGLITVGWHLARTHRRIIASAQGVRLESQMGAAVHEETWEAAAVRDVTLEKAFTSNTNGQNSDMHRAVILLHDRARGFGTGHAKADLETAVAALRTALGKDQPAS